MDLVSLLDDGRPKKSTKSIPLIIFGTVIGSLTVALTAISAPFVFPFFRRICLPYVPATTQQVVNVLEALRGRSGTLIDLGSGDGRIVIAAAQKGFKSTGIELNPWLVIYSKIAALYSGLQKRAKFHKQDLWKFDLKPYENVVIFGVETMMDELEKKFIKELNSGTCIVACRFPLNKLRPVKTIGHGINQVWIYQIRSLCAAAEEFDIEFYKKGELLNYKVVKNNLLFLLDKSKRTSKFKLNCSFKKLLFWLDILPYKFLAPHICCFDYER